MFFSIKKAYLYPKSILGIRKLTWGLLTVGFKVTRNNRERSKKPWFKGVKSDFQGAMCPAQF